MFRFIFLFLFVFFISYVNHKISTDYSYISDGIYAKYYKEISKRPLTNEEYQNLKKREEKEIERATSRESMGESLKHFYLVYFGFSLGFCILYYLAIRLFFRQKEMANCFIDVGVVFMGNVFFLSFYESVFYSVVSLIFLLHSRKYSGKSMRQ